MKCFDDFLKKNHKPNKNEENELVIQDFELNSQFSKSNFEVIAIGY